MKIRKYVIKYDDGNVLQLILTKEDEGEEYVYDSLEISFEDIDLVHQSLLGPYPTAISEEEFEDEIESLL